MKRPGKWAMVYEANTARTAYNIRTDLMNGRYRVPEGTWEFKARKTPKGGRIYGRYLGPKETPAATTAGLV